MFVAYDVILPVQSFVQLQGGTDLPFSTRNGPRSMYLRSAFGKSFSQHEFGRMWSPMVEIVGTRDSSTELAQIGRRSRASSDSQQAPTHQGRHRLRLPSHGCRGTGAAGHGVLSVGLVRRRLAGGLAMRGPLIGLAIATGLIFATGTARAQTTLLRDSYDLSGAAFQTSDRCFVCHKGANLPSGPQVTIGTDWRSSVMANSSRDPYGRRASGAKVSTIRARSLPSRMNARSVTCR